eukprot:c15091_g1_i1 orf=131-334(+)
MCLGMLGICKLLCVQKLTKQIGFDALWSSLSLINCIMQMHGVGQAGCKIPPVCNNPPCDQTWLFIPP